MEEIARAVSASYETFAYNKVASNGGSILGFNYSTVIANYFLHSSDIVEPAKINEDIEVNRDYDASDDVKKDDKDEEEDKKEEENNLKLYLTPS